MRAEVIVHPFRLHQKTFKSSSEDLGVLHNVDTVNEICTPLHEAALLQVSASTTIVVFLSNCSLGHDQVSFFLGLYEDDNSTWSCKSFTIRSSSGSPVMSSHCSQHHPEINWNGHTNPDRDTKWWKNQCSRKLVWGCLNDLRLVGWYGLWTLWTGMIRFEQQMFLMSAADNTPHQSASAIHCCSWQNSIIYWFWNVDVVM